MISSTAVKRARLLVFSLLLALILAEAGLQLAFVQLPVPFLTFAHRDLKDRSPAAWERIRERMPFMNVRREDPDTGWTFKPNLRLAGQNEDGEAYDRTTSADGFFTPGTVPADTNQLVMLGDSFLATYYVREPLQWAVSRLAGTPVFSLGAGGWGPDNYLAAYEKFARGRRHDRVVVVTFLNDISDVENWERWRHTAPPGVSFLSWVQAAFPTSTVNGGQGWLDRRSVAWNYAKYGAGAMARGEMFRSARLETSQPSAVPVGQPSVAPVPPEKSPSSTQSPLPVLRAPAMEATPTASAGEFGAPGRRFDLQFMPGLPFMLYEPEAFFPGGSYYPYMQAYFESLERLRMAVRARGAEMVLVWMPTKERVYLPLLAPERRRQYAPAASLDGLERVMAAYAAQSRTPYLDLTPEFTARAAEGEQLYFTADGHLNSHGNMVAGELIARHLVPTELVAPAAEPGGPDVWYRAAPLTIQLPLTLGASTYRATIVSALPQGWRARGTAEAPFSYLAQWPEHDLASPGWYVVRGVVRSGGLTLGLLKDGAWYLQRNVTDPGPFDIAIPVPVAGRYTPLVANYLPGGSLKTDVEIQAMGFSPRR